MVGEYQCAIETTKNQKVMVRFNTFTGFHVFYPASLVNNTYVISGDAFATIAQYFSNNRAYLVGPGNMIKAAIIEDNDRYYNGEIGRSITNNIYGTYMTFDSNRNITSLKLEAYAYHPALQKEDLIKSRHVFSCEKMSEINLHGNWSIHPEAFKRIVNTYYPGTL